MHMIISIIVICIFYFQTGYVKTAVTRLNSLKDVKSKPDRDNRIENKVPNFASIDDTIGVRQLSASYEDDEEDEESNVINTLQQRLF